MQNITLEIGDDGIALATLEVSGKQVNVISKAVQADLEELVKRLAADSGIRGAILLSRKPGGLCAGADLAEMLDDIAKWRAASTQDELRAGVEDAGNYSRQLRALETLGKPIASIVTGAALGGGFELALAAHYRVAVRSASLRMALPEADIGLMPGAGATQRLIRIMGIDAALPYLLDGTVLALDDALAGGVIHEAADSIDDAISFARNWIVSPGQPHAPWDVKGFKIPKGGPHTPSGYQVFGPAIARHLSGRESAPGAGNILKSVYEGSQVPIDAGLRIESRYFFNTARSPEAKVMIEAFFANRSSRTKAPA